ncbi:MAG: 50S ribosomal protein L22 [Flavobacteriales bacterium]|nr:50S ribosomal protein L22 [Flavobacteriales bacterium]MCB9163410.1 50S ribosomal protein L22 [Flavobacteriales bacterium]HNR54038.1 50S ribosomal protein L22 [Flavobacteriales bacterium]HPF90079.1 50S ribosomal protein L22 [Flavobacteriales bacterium]
MGQRKKLAADARKEAMKTVAIAHLRNVPTSPRRMRQVADLIRGVEVEKALGILRFSTRHSSRDLEKLLLSAVSNWQAKNEGQKADEAGLFVKSVQVNEARGLKRMLPAPQGRAYRMKKRSNHVSLIVDTKEA